MDNNKIVIQLIREQIRNKLLMDSLENLGFDCSSYSMNISEEILTLVGFQDKTDNLFQWYFDLLDKAMKDTTYWNLDEAMQKWSIKIYDDLLAIKLSGILPLD